MNFKSLLLSAASIISVALTPSAHAQSLIRVAGRVESLSPCTILPREERPTMCTQVIVPIAGKLRITSRSGLKRTIPIRSDGTFSIRLAPGRYSVRLAEAYYNGERTPVSELILSSNTLNVTKSGARHLYIVTHRSNQRIAPGPIL